MPQTYSPKIVSSALNDPLRVIAQNGGDAARICELTGIRLDAAPDMMSLRDFVRFTDIAAREMRFPEFGWAAGAMFNLRNIGELGHFVLEAPTLRAALSLFRRAFAIVQSDSELTMTVEGDEAVLSYSILDLSIWPRHQDAELTLSLLHSMVKSVAGTEWRPTLVTLEHDTSALWKNMAIGPRCAVQYNAPTNSLRFPARLLDLPMHDIESGHFSALSQVLTKEAHEREREAPVTVRVRREITRRLGRDSFDQTEIAGVLGFSRRTLRRRLEDEDHSFSDILSECRVRCAERMLRMPGTPLALIAEHLGYTEVSAFERAFRSRRGMTPAQYRKRNADQDAIDGAR